MVGTCVFIFIHSDNFCFLMGIFNPFTFKVIIGVNSYHVCNRFLFIALDLHLSFLFSYFIRFELNIV